MGSAVTFDYRGQTVQGYLASPDVPGPGVIVIQEWWGLVGHITSVADRFAEAGFNALAPDFYNGKSTSEPDEAGSLMMALDVPNAANIIQAAAKQLIADPKTTGEKVGVVGFCMGGQLALFAAGVSPRIGACVDYYGIHPNVHPDFERFQCPVLGFFAEHDDYAGSEAVAELDSRLTRAGVAHTFHTFPGTYHAFFNNDRPEVFDPGAADDSWDKMTAFFRSHLVAR